MTHLQLFTIVTSVALLTAPLPARGNTRVVDENGRPVEGAKVTIVLPATDSASALFGRPRVAAASDERGGLPFSLPRVKGAIVVVDHERYAPEVIDADPLPTLITLRKGATIGGRLFGDGERAPWPGDVCAIWTLASDENERGLDIRRCAGVAADGTWLLEALPSANVRLEIKVPMYLPLTTSIAVPGKPWEGQLEAGLRALLHIEDPRGRPAAGASVECTGAAPSTSDSLGNAWIAVPGSPSTCTASTLDAVSSSTAIHAPQAEAQTLRLRRTSHVTGAIVGEDGEKLLMPRFFLLEEIADVGRRAIHVEPTSHVGGTFRIRLPDGGRHAVRVEAPGSLPLTTEWFAASPGETVDLGVLVIRRGAGIRGQLVDAQTGKPLAGAVVKLEPQGSARIVLGSLGRASAVTDGDGHFTVAGLMVASYRARIEWESFAPAEFVVDLFREEIVGVGSVALRPGVRISGKIERYDGLPLSGARIELVPSNAQDAEPQVSTTTASGGTFGPVVSAPCSCRLLLYAPDLLWDQEIEVRADRPSERLEVRIRSARLTGRVIDRGVPVSGGEVVLQRVAGRKGGLGVAMARNPRSGRQLWAGRVETPLNGVVDAQGIFSVDDVPAERMIVEYFGRSGEWASRAVDVPDKPEVSVTIAIDGWDLKGRLIDRETGTGLTGTVELLDPDGVAMSRASSGPFGEFRIQRVRPGDYRMTATADGYRMTDTLHVRIGNEAPPTADVRMTRAAEATLDLVLNRDAATPASGVAVVIVDSTGRQLRALPTLLDGNLHVSGLPPGVVHVIWSDPLAGVGLSPPIVLASGPQKVSMQIVPGKDLVLHCEAGECSGARVGWLSIRDRSGIDIVPFLLRSGALVYSESAKAHVGRLAPGTYDVTAASGELRLKKSVEVGNGPGEVDLFLERQ